MRRPPSDWGAYWDVYIAFRRLKVEVIRALLPLMRWVEGK